MNEKVHAYLRSQNPNDFVMPYGRFQEGENPLTDINEYFSRVARHFVANGLFEKDPVAVAWNQSHPDWDDKLPETIFDLVYGNGRISVAIHEANPSDKTIRDKRANIVMADQLVLAPALFYPYVARALPPHTDNVYNSSLLKSIVSSITMPITDEKHWAGKAFLPDEHSYSLDIPRFNDSRNTFTRRERRETADLLNHIPEIALAMATYQSLVLGYLGHLSEEYHEMAFKNFESMEAKVARGLSIDEAISELMSQNAPGEMGVLIHDWGEFQGYQNQWASSNVYQEPMVAMNVILRANSTEPYNYEALADSITADTFKQAMQLTNGSGSFMQRVEVPAASTETPGLRREITFHCPGKAMLMTHLGDGALLGMLYKHIRTHREEEPIKGYLADIMARSFQ